MIIDAPVKHEPRDERMKAEISKIKIVLVQDCANPMGRQDFHSKHMMKTKERVSSIRVPVKLKIQYLIRYFLPARCANKFSLVVVFSCDDSDKIIYGILELC